MTKLKVGVVGLGFANFNLELGRKYYTRARNNFSQNYVDTCLVEEVIETEADCQRAINKLKQDQIDLLVVINATFGWGGHIVKLVEELPKLPIIQWSFPEPNLEEGKLELNSFCGANINASFMYRLDVNYELIYGYPEEKEIQQQLDEFLRAAWLKKKLAESKFCLVGNRVPGFYLSNADELRLRQEVGPELVHLSVATLLTEMEKQPEAKVKAELEKMKGEVDEVTVAEDKLRKTAQAYLYLKKKAQTEELAGYAVKCWPELQEEEEFSICAAVARLNAEEIITACEGDIPGAVTMRLLNLAAKEPVTFLDLVNVDRETDLLTAWHCGPTAYNLAGKDCTTSYCSHPTLGEEIGAAADFSLQEGPVTLARLSEGPDTYRLFLLEGIAKPVSSNVKGNTTHIQPEAKTEEIMKAIIGQGIEHHYALVHQRVASLLQTYAQLAGLQVIRPGEEHYG